MANEPSPEQQAESRAAQHETLDIKSSGLVKFIVALTIGVAISMALMSGLYRWLARWIAGGAPVSRYALQREDRLPPLPRQLAATGNRFKPEDFTDDPVLQQGLSEGFLNFELQRTSRYREVYEQIKQQELTSYGALTKQPGQFHIPIEEAKRLMLARGAAGLAPLTGAPQASPAPAVTNGTNGSNGQAQNDQSASALAEGAPSAASAGRLPERRRQ